MKDGLSSCHMIYHLHPCPNIQQAIVESYPQHTVQDAPLAILVSGLSWIIRVFRTGHEPQGSKPSAVKICRTSMSHFLPRGPTNQVMHCNIVCTCALILMVQYSETYKVIDETEGLQLREGGHRVSQALSDFRWEWERRGNMVGVGRKDRGGGAMGTGLDWWLHRFTC